MAIFSDSSFSFATVSNSYKKFRKTFFQNKRGSITANFRHHFAVKHFARRDRKSLDIQALSPTNSPSTCPRGHNPTLSPRGPGPIVVWAKLGGSEKGHIFQKSCPFSSWLKNALKSDQGELKNALSENCRKS